ncbi:MAG: lytic transglycosylase domain-containing protein [Pseudomonadota bacterium]|nr:lytic transglycosylase domain-containing protein [Pseudomonadota bacterium]
MTKLDRFGSSLRSWRTAALGSASVFLRDVGHGLLEVSHNSLALLGLVVVGVLLFTAGRSDVRHALESQTLNWLQARQEARAETLPSADEPDLSEPEAIARATASDPKDLSRAQAAVAIWLARRYHVAPEPVSRLVQEAWRVGEMTQLDPTLILAVMAVESSFNPFAQSPVGAQGLMQVMTKVHDDKYEAFGGSHAAFDPVTNLRVGVQVLKECIARAGSLEAGLRFYVGAANSDDGGYATKVLTEQNILRQLAGLKALPLPTRHPVAALADNADAPSSTAALAVTTPALATPATTNPAGAEPLAKPVEAGDPPEKIALLR